MTGLGQAESVVIRRVHKRNPAAPDMANDFPAVAGKTCFPHFFMDMPDRWRAGGVDCPPPGTPPLCLLAVQAGAERSCEAARPGKKMNALMWRLRPLTKGIPWSGPLHITPSPKGWPGAPSRRSHAPVRGRGPSIIRRHLTASAPARIAGLRSRPKRNGPPRSIRGPVRAFNGVRALYRWRVPWAMPAWPPEAPSRHPAQRSWPGRAWPGSDGR